MNRVEDFDVVVFDMDGVLIDSNRSKVQAMQRTIDELHTELSAEFIGYFESNFGKSRQQHFGVYRDMLSAVLAGDLFAKLDLGFSAYSEEAYLSAQVIPGVRQLLAMLESKGVTLYVATGSPQEKACTVLQDKGLSRFFKAIYGGPVDKVSNLRKIQDAESTNRILFIGDSIQDIKSSEACDLNFALFAPYSLHSKASLMALKTERWVAELDSFDSLLPDETRV